MRKLNKKGFTLIELLAVIVILAVVLGIAIPAVSQYITKSRKNGYKDNLIQFIDAARKGATLGDEYSYPIDTNDATVIPFSVLSIAIEKGGVKSSYDLDWVADGSYVIIVNTGSADSPSYDYYVVASDSKYVTGSNKTLEIINEKSLEASNVIRLNSEKGYGTITKDQKFTVSSDGTRLVASKNGEITVTEVAGTSSTD